MATIMPLCNGILKPMNLHAILLLDASSWGSCVGRPVRPSEPGYRLRGHRLPAGPCKEYLSISARYDKFTVHIGKHALHYPLRRWFVCLTQRKTLMKKRVAGKFGRRALWISPVIIVIGGFLAALHWLKPQNTTFVM